MKMCNRLFAGAFALLALIWPVIPVDAQGEPSGTLLPRTADGHPDLGGIWDFRTITPLERPVELADQEFLSDEEIAAFEAETAVTRNADLNREALAKIVTGRGTVNGTTETRDLALAYNDFWWDRGTQVVGTKRTSLIVDPSNGRIPSLTAEGERKRSVRQALSQRITEGPEDRSVAERCLLGFNSGPPMLPGGYNQNVHLFQTSDYVAILNEMVHNVRIVPLDGRPHGTLAQWTGDSRGFWDGDTLVVETKNFRRETSFRGSSKNLNLTERFTRIDSKTLLYEFTVEDPTTWMEAWSVEVPMQKSENPMFEYACHEGNYGMEGTLSGARALERNQAAGASR
jgi:hypothetical protein